MGRDYKGASQIAVGMPNGVTVNFSRSDPSSTIGGYAVEISDPRQIKGLRAYGLTVEPIVPPDDPAPAKAPKTKAAPAAAEKE